MHAADAMALALVAFADLAFIAHLRKLRIKRERAARMMWCLRVAIRREIADAEVMAARVLKRAS